ncbi:hypothetical protein ACEPAG_9507 [Sanghuangporus baumii]
MCNKTINPFLEGVDELSGALARFQHAADELCRTIDNCASTLQKIDVEDYPDPFKALGFLRAAVNHCCGTFNDSQAAVSHHIYSSAMKYGLKRLPTELLSRIFLDATSNVRSTIRLSHVSKQFRSIVNQSPAFWQRFRLSSKWSQEQIRAVAERSVFRSLKADVYYNGDEPDSILSFHSCLEELSIIDFSMDFAEGVRRRLGFLHFPSLQVLRFEHSYFSTLEHLHPQEFFGMPSLRMLDVDFVPHNSMARNLVELHLDLGKVSLMSLLDFLSSTNVLQDLSIFVLLDDETEQEVPDHEPVLLPELAKLSFEVSGRCLRSASIIARKIRSSSLRTLVLRGDVT